MSHQEILAKSAGKGHQGENQGNRGVVCFGA
jgi:hypothetical protein